MMKRRGFSLIEILIVVVVVAIALMGLMASLAFGLQASGNAERMTEATNHARRVVGIIRADATSAQTGVFPGTAPYTPNNALENADDSERTALNAAPLTDLPGDTNMERNIQITYLTDPGGQPQRDNLARIQVRVFWTVKGQEHMVEMVAFQRDPNS